MTTRKIKLPAVATPPGVLFAVVAPSPNEVVYGMFDLDVRFAGSKDVRAIRVFIDEEQQGEEMTKIGRLRYALAVETAVFVDGAHTLAVAAFDEKDRVIATIFTPLVFRNVQNFNFVSLVPTPDLKAYEAVLRINTMRAEMSPSLFLAVDKLKGERRPLKVAVAYDGSTINGTPLPRVTLSREGNPAIEDGLHQISITIVDNFGQPSTRTSHFVRIKDGAYESMESPA